MVSTERTIALMDFEITHEPPKPGELEELYLDASWHSDLRGEDLARSILATTHWLRAEQSRDDGSRVVGVVRLQTDFVFYCAVYDLLVHSSCRRRGVGSALLEAALKWAREHEIKQVHLWPVPGLAPFYEKHGFESLGPDQPLMRISR